MSGPVSPPLTVKEADGTPSGRPINTIVVSNGDLSITGSTATIDTSGAGGGAALTDTQVGFGSSSNLLTGSSLFTYDDTAGSELLTISGSGTSDLVKLVSTDAAASAAPRFTMYRNSASPANNDFTGRVNFRGEKADGSELDYGVIINRITDVTNGNGRLQFLAANGTATNIDNSQLTINGSSVVINEAQNDVDFRVEGDTTGNLIRTNAGQDNVGINCNPDSAARFMVSDDGGFAATVRIESTDGDADVGPTVQLFRNSGSVANDDSIGSLIWKGKDSAGNSPDYAKIYCRAEDTTNEDADMRFEIMRNGVLVDQFRIRHSQVVVNESAADTDFRVETASDTHAFQVDSGRNSVGIGIQGTQSSKLTVKADGAFDPTTSTVTDMENTINIDSSAAPAGHGNYGGALTFSGVGSSRRRAGIANVQTTSDTAGDEVGLAFLTHDPASPSTDETLNEHMRLDDNGRLFISDTDIGTDTAAGRLAVREVNAGNATALLESTESSNADYGPVLELYRNSSSPANNDTIGQIIFTANDNTPNKIEYFRINVIQKDVTSAGEDSTVDFQIYEGGTARTHLRLDKNEVVVNDSQRNVDFRVESDNRTHLLMTDASTNQVGVGAAPSSSLVADPVLQVPNDAGVASYIYQTASTTSPMTLTDNDLHSVLIVHASSSALTINLPADGGIKGQYFRFVSTGGNVTISPSAVAGDTINGGTGDLTRSTDYQVYECICIANNTWVLSNP